LRPTVARSTVSRLMLVLAGAACLGTQGLPDERATGRVLDLVADDALVKVKTMRADGQVRELQFPAREWKDLIRETWALAAGGKPDITSYSNCHYMAEGKSVRLTCTTQSQRDPAPSSLTLLIGPGTSDRWLIREHIVESRVGK
jgi:hypothetical protein